MAAVLGSTVIDSILLRVSLAVSLEITARVLNDWSMRFNIFINDLFFIQCLIFCSIYFMSQLFCAAVGELFTTAFIFFSTLRL